MKNLKLFNLTLILAITFFSCTKNDSLKETQSNNVSNHTSEKFKRKSFAVPTTAAELCGAALADVVIATNDLSYSQACTLRNILYDEALGQEEKWTAIDAEPTLSSYVSVIENSISVLDAQGFTSIYNVPVHKTVIEDQVLYNLGFDPLWVANRPNEDPCAAYKAGAKACAAGFVVCAAGSAFTGPAWGVVLGLCGIQLMLCVDANDASHPNCVPGGTIVVSPNIQPTMCD